MDRMKAHLGRGWGLVLAVAALLRASSYAVRPPARNLTTELIEGFLAYQVWAILLTIAAVLIVAGVFAGHLIGFAGHVIAVFCYATFSLSVFWAALFYGQSWTGGAALVIVAGLHGERVIALGSRHGEA